MQYRSDGLHVAPDFEVCVLDLVKIDAAWKAVDDVYLPPGGVLGSHFPQGVIDHHKKRYDAVARTVAEECIHMPVICLDEDGDLRIVDGRHRIAVCRDAGLGRIQVVVPAHQQLIILERFT